MGIALAGCGGGTGRDDPGMTDVPGFEVAADIRSEPGLPDRGPEESTQDPGPPDPGPTDLAEEAAPDHGDLPEAVDLAPGDLPEAADPDPGDMAEATDPAPPDLAGDEATDEGPLPTDDGVPEAAPDTHLDGTADPVGEPGSDTAEEVAGSDDSTGTDDVSTDRPDEATVDPGDDLPLDPSEPADDDVADPGTARDEAADEGVDLSNDSMEAADEAGVDDADACIEGEGCFGDFCRLGEDCRSGLCVDHQGGRACTRTCNNDCPDGWTCDDTPAQGRICLSRAPVLCRPCGTDDDCRDDAGRLGTCVAQGPQGSFCGAGCDDLNPCPAGYDCSDRGVSQGGRTCVLSSGTCDCSAWAIEASLGTPCSLANSFGTCAGRRVCAPGGLSACDARLPAPEVCDGVDNDCSGSTDEGTCDDGNRCTVDSCEAVGGCTNVPDPQRCDDGIACTVDSCDPADGSCSNPVVAETCLIDGACHADGEAHPQDSCRECAPDAARTDWTPSPGTKTCDDTLFCTIDDRCDGAGSCQGTTRGCDDGLACTADRCGETERACLNERIAGTCLIDGTCVDNHVVEPGNACRWCDDTALADAWSPVPDNALCDDGVACTVNDQCTAGTCSGSAVTCSSKARECVDASTSREFAPGACNPLSGQCEWASTDTTCPFGCDGTAGTCLPDPCVGIVCDSPPDPVCFLPTGTCSSGLCSYLPLPGTGCDDMDPCTTGDTCDGAGRCGGNPMACDTPTDAQCQATPGSCSGGSCAYTSQVAGTPCSDGDACTVSDACNDAGACTAGTPIVCTPPGPACRGDERVVTTSACDPATGACLPTEVTTLCPFGCDTALGACRPDPCQGVVCNSPPGSACFMPTGTCSGGACTYTPMSVGATCDDGDACTVDDACTGTQACLGTPRICAPGGPACSVEGDSVLPTTGTCQQETGACLFQTVTTPCPLGCDPSTGLCNRVRIAEFRTRGPLGGNDEYFELFNIGSAAIDISGWKLNGSNTSGLTSTRATVPSGTVIQARGFYLFVLPGTPGAGYSGAVAGDVTYSTGISDNGGCALLDAAGNVVDQVGMSLTSAYKEGTVLTPLAQNLDQSFRRRTVFCGPDQDTDDNGADFVYVAPGTPHSSASCGPECSSVRCTARPAACTDANTLTTWLATCNPSELCENTPQPATCLAGCDDATAACRDSSCAGITCDTPPDPRCYAPLGTCSEGACTYLPKTPGTACEDNDACTVGDACLAGTCFAGPAADCDDLDACTADRCEPARGCVHDPAACCGDGTQDPLEECDDWNREDGDGCSADCHVECPTGTVLEAGYCWVQAQAGETQVQACTRIGRTPTPPEVTLTWDAAALARVAAAWGYASAGDDGEAAPAMWCNQATATCETHAFGTRFFNYGWRAMEPGQAPVYTCAVSTGPALPLPQLDVHFIDVGQGDAILLDSGDLEIVIDGGPESPAAANYLASRVNGPIELMVVTHPHTDHYGGLIQVMASYQVDEIWINGETGDGPLWPVYQNALNAEVAAGARLRIVDRTQTGSAGDFGFQIQSPPLVHTGDTNGDSIGLHLVHGAVSYEFTGDMITSTESGILAAGFDVRSRILKIAHHGSRTSSSAAFLDAVLPQVAIYQAQLNNPYGHPHAEPIQRLTERGATIYGTSVNGTIVVHTDGTTYQVLPER